MRRRQPPVVWLFTDPRQGEALWAAARRLPRGSGIVLRGADADTAERLVRIARRRGLILVDEADVAKAHDRAELIAARRAGARLVFVAPVFATRTHPGARPLGTVRFGLLVRRAGVPVAALGGMDGATFPPPATVGSGRLGRNRRPG